MRDIIGWMLGISDRIDLYCVTTSGSNRRRLKTKVDKPNWQLLHLLWEKWRSLHESVRLRATIGVNSPYYPRKKSSRMTSKGAHSKCHQGLIYLVESVSRPWSTVMDIYFLSGTCRQPLSFVLGTGRSDLLLSAMPTAGQSVIMQVVPGIF